MLNSVHEKCTKTVITQNCFISKQMANWPFNVDYLHFTRYSDDLLLDNAIPNKKHILIGGQGDGTTFHEISQTPEGTKWRSVNEWYHKKNADIERIETSSSRSMRSFITKDNNFIIVYERSCGYNVYDFENDCWLVEPGCDANTTINASHFKPACLLINDKIFVISAESHVKFYVLTQNFKVPVLVKKYHVDHSWYRRHGMCLIDVKKDCDKAKQKQKGKQKESKNKPASDEKESVNSGYHVTILLFGGNAADDDAAFMRSFVTLNVEINFDNNVDINDSKYINNLIEKQVEAAKSTEKENTFDDVVIDNGIANINIVEACIKPNDIECVNFAKSIYTNRNEVCLYDFGTQVIRNGENKVLVIIFGGDSNGKDKDDHNTSVVVFDVAKRELSRYKGVKCVDAL